MEAEFEFKREIKDSSIGEVIKYCYTCSKCSDNCPVTAVTTGLYSTTEYNPRQNILMSLLGYKSKLIEGDDLVLWGCTVCENCDAVCPQKIELTEIFTFLKNQSIALGKGPENIYSQAKSIFDHAKAIPSQPAIKKRRKQLGLPEVVAPDVGEIQTLLKNIGVDKKLKKSKGKK